MAWQVYRLAYDLCGTADDILYDFRFTPMHDLESIWWIAIWILLRKSPIGEDRSDAQTKLYVDVFNSKILRGLFLGNNGSFISRRWFLPPQFKSDEIIHPLDDMRRKLMESYKEATRSPVNFNSEPYRDEKLPSFFDEKLTKIVEYLEHRPVEFQRK